MIIDLRSDTVTKPTKPMLEAMFAAEVGDDVFGEDPTVIALEQKAAKLFEKDAGLFCPSGTMTNQIAIKVHTNPGDELLCDETAHIYNYEGGAIAFNSGVQPKLLKGDRGRISARQIQENINDDFDWLPRTALVSIENTANKAGGSIYSKTVMQEISDVCKKNNLKFHLDGARIFNALTETNDKPDGIGNLFDSISICLSKGLGTPAGSVLLGNKEFIYKARRIRKVLGGGMRQAGYLAAAGIFALDNNIQRLKNDHRRAKELEAILKKRSFVKNIFPVETNIVIFELNENFLVMDFIMKMFMNGIKVIPMGPQKIRMVTHLDFTDEMLEKVKDALENIK